MGEEELLKYKPYGVNGGTFYRSVSEISNDLNEHVRSVENKFGLDIDIGDWMKFAVAHDTQVTSAVYNSNWYHSLHTGSTLGELTLSNQDARRALLDKPKKDPPYKRVRCTSPTMDPMYRDEYLFPE